MINGKENMHQKYYSKDLLYQQTRIMRKLFLTTTLVIANIKRKIWILLQPLGWCTHKNNSPNTRQCSMNENKPQWEHALFFSELHHGM